MRLETLIAEKHPSGLYRLAKYETIQQVRAVVEAAHYRLFHLAGDEIVSKEDLFSRSKMLFELPENLGENWDAFYDYLTGFAWPMADGYVLLYTNYETFAKANPDDFQKALRIFQAAADNTDHNRKFYVLLHGDESALPDDFVGIAVVEV